MTLDTAETMRIIMNEPIAQRAHGRSGFAGNQESNPHRQVRQVQLVLLQHSVQALYNG